MEFVFSDTFLVMALVLFALGALAGVLAGLLGIGGGIVLVPGLYFVFTALGYQGGEIMHLCVGTSLASIIFTGGSSALGHAKRGAVDFLLLKQIGIGIVIGVGVMSALAGQIEGRVLAMIFAGVLVVLAGVMMFDPLKHLKFQDRPKPLTLAFGGVFNGAVSTMMGIGGATLNVPFMVSFGTPMHRAVGTASALGVVIAIPAAIGFVLIGLGAEGLPPFSLGYVNILAVGVVLSSSIVCARLGVRLAHIMPVLVLRRVFAVLIVIAALKMIAELYS